MAIMNKSLFGAKLDPVLKSTPLGIRFNSNGFDQLTDKQKTKRLKKLNKTFDKENIPDSTKSELLDYFESLPNMASWFDVSYSHIRDLWIACGGAFKETALKINPWNITISVEEAPFFVPYYKVFAVGMTEPSLNGAITLSVVALTEQGNPPTFSWVRNLNDLSRWEIGNYFAYRHGIKDREVGDGKPC